MCYWWMLGDHAEVLRVPFLDLTPRVAPTAGAG
jgi:hypothetical protein